MPVKIDAKVTYTVDIKIPSLEFEKQMVVDERGLSVIYGEIDELARALADKVGALRLPNYHTPTRSGSSLATTTKLLEYAETHSDFTIKGASECLSIPQPTLYTAAQKLCEEGTLKRTQVLGGVAYIYALVKKEPPVSQVVVLPEGKLPYNKPLVSPERERMQSR